MNCESPLSSRSVERLRDAGWDIERAMSSIADGSSDVMQGELKAEEEDEGIREVRVVEDLGGARC